MTDLQSAIPLYRMSLFLKKCPIYRRNCNNFHILILGVLDADEIKESLKKIGIKASDADVQRLLKK